MESVQGMKKKVREALGGEGVAYVDTRVGAPEAWIRLNHEQFRIHGYLFQISGAWTQSRPGDL